MDRKADLHIHTTASDGRLTPQEVVASAIGAGLAGVAFLIPMPFFFQATLAVLCLIVFI